ncbi:MAG: LPS export ABC transporter permease LptG [Beggiatoa sp. IS2]|nr:MAG: LPS export ABC transporter permease LptG [Beggiatoa sp. IS2]
MTKIKKYIGQTLLINILLVLLVLVGLFTFFSFINEVDDIGKQNYGVWQAVQYVLLETPRNIYSLFPTAALLGSLAGLGMLANHNELTAMRAAGISIADIAIAVLRLGLTLMLVAMVIGEVVAPRSEQYATNMRAIAQSERQQMVFSTRYGFWARDGNNFINIRTILADGGFGDVTLYEFDDNRRLQAIVHGAVAYYRNERWFLEDVEKTQFDTTQVNKVHLAETFWKAILNPDLVKIVVVYPEKLSSLGLYKYIQYLQKSEQNSEKYELALWTRLSYPLINIVMILLAVPFVFGSLRSVSIGQRLLVGALLGISFHMLNQISGHFGLVYGLNPIVSALTPSLLFLGLAVVLMRRVI